MTLEGDDLPVTPAEVDVAGAREGGIPVLWPGFSGEEMSAVTFDLVVVLGVVILLISILVFFPGTTGDDVVTDDGVATDDCAVGVRDSVTPIDVAGR